MEQPVDFVITQVWRGTSADVLAQCASVGEAAAHVDVAAYVRQEIDAYVEALGQPDISLGLVESLGKELGDLLLPEPVRKLFLRARSLRGGNRLRVRLLQFDRGGDGPTWNPAALPWEFADVRELDEGGSRALLDLEGVSFVRHPVAASASRALVTRDELRVLTVLNSRVGGHAELLDLQPAIGDPQMAPSLRISSQVVSKVVRNATLDDLETVARDMGGLDLFEYSGHGVEGGGGLLFHATGGQLHARVDEGDLAVLHQAQVQVVLLNACDTAAARDGSTNVAEALVRGGVPVVVAMQLPVRNRVASQFGRAFGRALLAGRSVDDAVADGRSAVKASNRDPRTWLAPVVFTRTDDGVIFRADIAQEATAGAVPTVHVPAPAVAREVAPAAEERRRETWDAAHEPFAFIAGAGAGALYEDRRRLLVASLDGTALVVQDATGRTTARLPTGLDEPVTLIAGQDRRLLMAVDGDVASYVQLDPGPGWPASPSPIGISERVARVFAFRSEGSGLSVVVGGATTTRVLRLNARGRVLKPGPEVRAEAVSAALLGAGLVWISADGRLHTEAVASPRVEPLLSPLPRDGWHYVDVDSSTPAGETVALLRSVDGGTELFVVDAEGVRSAAFGTQPGRLQLVRSFAPQGSGLVALSAEDGVRVFDSSELPAWGPEKGVQR